MRRVLHGGGPTIVRGFPDGARCRRVTKTNTCSQVEDIIIVQWVLQGTAAGGRRALEVDPVLADIELVCGACVFQVLADVARRKALRADAGRHSLSFKPFGAGTATS